MAIPQGNFTAAGAGITSPGGAYTYAPGLAYPQYFAGTFFIDTGYDDPVVWTEGVEAAEVYAARVYATASTYSPGGLPADTFLGKWNIVATPMWQAKHYALPATLPFTQARVLIKCDVYLSEPVDETSTAWQRLEEVDWSLYRI